MKKSFGRIIVCVLFLMPLLTSNAQAFATKKGGKTCIECHPLDKKAAEEIVKKIVPAATVTDVKMSPIKGVWQIEFSAGEGKRGGFGLDFSKKYLVQFASVEDVIKQQQPQPPRKVDVSKIPLTDALTVGSKTAAKKVIVFSDPDCPYCRELHKLIKTITAKRTDIAFSIILHPLPMHKDAYKKSQAIICSKSVEMLDDAFAGKTIAEPPVACTPEAVEKNKALAKSLDFSGTPTLVRDDGLVLSGYLPEDKLMDWIDKKK